jgi:hypothetical protein
MTPGRAIAQAVSCWLPTTAAWVRARVWSSGIYGGQSGAGAGFLRVLQFPCQSSFHQILHHHNHSGQLQEVIQWPTCRVNPAGLHPHYANLKKLITRLKVHLLNALFSRKLSWGFNRVLQYTTVFIKTSVCILFLLFVNHTISVL